MSSAYIRMLRCYSVSTQGYPLMKMKKPKVNPVGHAWVAGFQAVYGKAGDHVLIL